MALLIPSSLNILLAYDTAFDRKPLTIYFNSEGQICELVYAGEQTTAAVITQFAQAELMQKVFPYIQVVEDPALPEPATTGPQPSTNPTNPAELLRIEAAEEAKKKIQ